MNPLWNTVMIILGVLLTIVTIFNCRNCIKEYKRIKDLTSPMVIVDAVRINQVVPLPPLIETKEIEAVRINQIAPLPPIVEGKEVEMMTENLEIIYAS